MSISRSPISEPQLIGERGKLSGTQWDDLVPLPGISRRPCSPVTAILTERFAVALPGRGTGLVTGTHTAHLTRGFRALLLDGFFPECDFAGASVPDPSRSKGVGVALCARLCGHTSPRRFFDGVGPLVDAILFNGGLVAS